MREKGEKIYRESKVAFAASVLLLNFLILAVAAHIFWVFWSLYANASSFGIALSGNILP